MNPSPRHARVKEIFLSASQEPEDKRASFLETACGDDEELRKEVESLLRHHGTATIISAPSDARPPKPRRARRIGPQHSLEETTWTSPATRFLESLFGTRRKRAVLTAIVVLFLLAIGFLVRSSTKDSLDDMLAANLETILEADVLALEIWIKERLTEARTWAGDPEVREAVGRLVAEAREHPGDPEFLRNSPALVDFERRIQPFLESGENLRASLVNDSGIVIAHPDRNRIGTRIPPLGWKFMSEIFEGNAVFVRPYREEDVVRQPIESSGVNAFTLTCAPVRHPRDEDNIIASLNLFQDAGERFTEILSVARMGASGETYVFDETALMLSESRFTDDLKTLGLIPDEPGSKSMLRLEVRDPGGNLYRGFKPTRDPAARPKTEIAALAIASRHREDPAGRRGVLIEPYRDYRGVEVIGAWRWLPASGMGIVTEVDASEAYAPLRKLDVAFGSLFGLLTVATGAYLYSAFSVARLQREIGVARKLGSYTLEKKIGEGGMGEVYLARHAMLKRPTAIKVLKRELATSEFRERFEREAQLASQLTHPNTIEIFDYGHSAEGIGYYVMEYIDGLDLARLVKDTGIVPPGRAVFLLRQVCGALREAHQRGIIHRDIKPHNLMVCARGGEFDVIKVLDFGLVKDIGAPPDTMPTAPSRITGTPMYMAPERLRDTENVDARADLYSVGAVGYYLLSGRTLFETASDLEVLAKVAAEPPAALSEAAGVAGIPPDLESLIMRCLEKDPADRPQSADEIIAALDRLAPKLPWSPEDARLWWESSAIENLPTRAS